MERCLACEAEGSWGVPLFLRRPARLLDYEGQVARPRREALPFTNHQSPFTNHPFDALEASVGLVPRPREGSAPRGPPFTFHFSPFTVPPSVPSCLCVGISVLALRLSIL
jgi:hypothetical protein